MIFGANNNNRLTLGVNSFLLKFLSVLFWGLCLSAGDTVGRSQFESITKVRESTDKLDSIELRRNTIFPGNGQYSYSISSIASKPVSSYFKLLANFLTDSIGCEIFVFYFSGLSDIHSTNFRILILYPFHVFW